MRLLHPKCTLMQSNKYPDSRLRNAISAHTRTHLLRISQPFMHTHGFRVNRELPRNHRTVRSRQAQLSQLQTPHHQSRRRHSQSSAHSQRALAPITTRRWRRHLQLRAIGHHPLEPNPDTLNHSQQNRTANRTVPYCSRTSSNSERTSREESGDDGVPGVFLFADTFDGAVEGGEHAAPDAEVAS